MRTIISLFSLSFLFFTAGFISKKNTSNVSNVETTSIHFFTGTWQEALDLAKKEDKLIFLDAYATWCGPCKKMTRNTFTNKKVADFYTKHFINLAVDMEKGEGITLSQKYAVTAYPTLLFLKADGSLIAKRVGYHKASEFLEIGQEIANIR